MQCKVCKRKAEKDERLCQYHSSARDALKRGYASYKIAYSGISWRDYLNIVKALEDTGQWIKEVISLEEDA